MLPPFGFDFDASATPKGKTVQNMEIYLEFEPTITIEKMYVIFASGKAICGGIA